MQRQLNDYSIEQTKSVKKVIEILKKDGASELAGKLRQRTLQAMNKSVIAYDAMSEAQKMRFETQQITGMLLDNQ